MEGLVKVAVSFDARRGKQYWQLLKRMHGGSDEAVNAIKQTGDDGIWHGTHPMMMDSIAKEGLHPSGKMALWGKGQYFAPKETASEYAKHTGDEGLLRLKKPSELRGTKEVYPNVQNAVKQDLQPGAVDELRSNARQGALFHKDQLVQDMTRTNENIADATASKYGNPVKKNRLQMNAPIQGLNKQLTHQQNEFKQVSQEMNQGFPSLQATGDQKSWPSSLQKFRTYGQKPLPFMDDVKTNYLVYGNDKPMKPSLLQLPKQAGDSVEGLAKLAEIDYEKLYDDNPDLDQLRLNELAANERYDNAHSAYMEEHMPAVKKGLAIGAGVGGGIGLLPGVLGRSPGVAAVGGIGGSLFGALVGGQMADDRHKNTSPLYQQRDKSLTKAINAQDAHVNRWLELAYPDEYKEAGAKMEGLAKVANVVELFGNQRNRLKSGVNPTNQQLLETENRLQEAENSHHQVQQAVQQAEGNLGEMKSHNARVEQQLGQLDGLFQRVGPERDRLLNSIHQKNIRQGVGMGLAGVGVAGAGLAGAVYAAKHRGDKQE